MGVISRLFKVGQAEANALVDKLEKPEKMLDQAIRDRQKQIGEVKKAVTEVIANEQQTKRDLEEARSNGKEWENKARMALKADKEELAAKALARAEEYEATATRLQPLWEQQNSEVRKLKDSITQMEEDLDSLRRQKDSIVAQYRAAEARKSIAAARTRAGSDKTGDLIERMQKKADRSAYLASASEELAETGGDSLEKEFDELGATNASSSVREKLAKMKAEL